MPRSQSSSAIISVPCRDYSGQSCDYVAKADGNEAATAGKLVNQVLALLSIHMGQAHALGLDSESREEIREAFGEEGWQGR